MYDSKTVRSDNDEQEVKPINLLYNKQKQDVAYMRASLLSCNTEQPLSVRMALHNVTVMRVYHQMSRIIRYTEMMDKLEDKLYDAIENYVDKASTASSSTWITLLNIQEKLQKSMIESHKLLQPYLDMEQFSTVMTSVISDDSYLNDDNSVANMLIDQDSRDKLRTSAQAVLAALESSNEISGNSTSDVLDKEGDSEDA